jgi:hypothetical protein
MPKEYEQVGKHNLKVTIDIKNAFNEAFRKYQSRYPNMIISESDFIARLLLHFDLGNDGKRLLSPENIKGMFEEIMRGLENTRKARKVRRSNWELSGAKINTEIIKAEFLYGIIYCQGNEHHHQWTVKQLEKEGASLDITRDYQEVYMNPTYLNIRSMVEARAEKLGLVNIYGNKEKGDYFFVDKKGDSPFYSALKFQMKQLEKERTIKFGKYDFISPNRKEFTDTLKRLESQTFEELVDVHNKKADNPKRVQSVNRYFKELYIMNSEDIAPSSLDE